MLSIVDTFMWPWFQGHSGFTVGLILMVMKNIVVPSTALQDVPRNTMLLSEFLE